MQSSVGVIKYKRTLKVLVLNIIIIAGFGLLSSSIAILMGIHFNRVEFPKGEPGLSFFLNPGLYLFPAILQFIVSLIIVIASIQVLKMKSRWILG